MPFQIIRNDIIINPWGRSFLLTKDLIRLIIQADKEGSAQ